MPEFLQLWGFVVFSVFAVTENAGISAALGLCGIFCLCCNRTHIKEGS